MPGHLAIITALKEEHAAVQRALRSCHPQINVVRAGVGPASAAAATEKLVQNQPSVIVSCGFCGGLAPGAELGDVILADRVLDGSGDGQPIVCDASRLQQWRTALESANIRVHVGALASVSAAVTTCEAKRDLGRKANALAVDMESYAIARRAQQSGIPMLVLRVISDTCDDALPAEIGGFLDEKGNVRASNVAKFALKGPRNIKMLMTLKSRSDRALATLKASWQALAPLIH
ncbi:MAG TPA: hypothetical protein VEJ63_17200 [Planctomycetota bacterium]|nr:hypothetical protein [Planctomycetota bacterium]